MRYINPQIRENQTLTSSDMYEQIKLNEARYFYSQMIAEYADRQKFTHNLSAFLSSARSVLQYGLEEAKTKPGGQHWYDKRVDGGSTLTFFKNKRDINIHEEPVKPVKHVSIKMKDTIHLSESVSIKRFDANGLEPLESSVETQEPREVKKTPDTPPVVTIKYKFQDWSGNEDIIELSQRYIDELQQFVKDGINSGFLTV